MLLVIVTLVLVKSLGLATDPRSQEWIPVLVQRLIMKDNDRVSKGLENGPDHQDLHKASHRHIAYFVTMTTPNL